MSNMLAQFASFVESQPNNDASIKFDMDALVAAVAHQNKRTRSVVPPQKRCDARVWANGAGSQCGHKKKDGCGDFCKKHHKQSLINDGEMFQFHPTTGKHVGLFWGRYADKNEDGSIPFTVVNSDGVEVGVCQWKNALNKSAVVAARKLGLQFHRFSGESIKRTTRTTVVGSELKPKRTKNAFMYYLENSRAEIRTTLESELEDVRVTHIAKRAGSNWKEMDVVARAPFALMANDAKTAATLALPILLDADQSILYTNESPQLDIVKHIEISQDIDDDQGLDVEYHTLSNGTTVLLDSDDNIYHLESHELIGTLDDHQ